MIFKQRSVRIRFVFSSVELTSRVDVYLSVTQTLGRVFFLGCLILSDKHDDLIHSKVLI